MPWVPLDVHFYQDPSIEAAAEDAGGGVLGTFAVLLAMLAELLIEVADELEASHA